MDIRILKDYIIQRKQLSEQYSQYKGRHMFFDKQMIHINRGLELLEMDRPLEMDELKELQELGKLFIQIRNSESISHNKRIQTEIGNKIHTVEYELYSMALDVFGTYGTMY